MYKVFFLTPGEFSPAVIMPGYEPAEFSTIEEAKAYISDHVREEDKVMDGDNSTSATICYEVYDGSPYDEEGEITKEPVYMSDEYYDI